MGVVPLGVSSYGKMKEKADLKGREVTCRVLGYLFEELPKKGISPEVLAEWSGYPLDHLRNKHERMSWSSFCRIHSKLGEIYTDEELMEFGKVYLKAPSARMFLIVARLLFEPVDFFKWILDPRRGMGVRNFTVAQPCILAIGKNSIKWEVTIKEGYEFCREFFIISRGTSTYISELLGSGKSAVEMEWIERGARYDVRLPSGGSPLARLRKAITWPFIARDAAEELREQHELLYQRYLQLEAEMKRRRETEERFRILVETAGEMIFTLENGKITSLNRAFEEFTGFKRDDWLGQDFRQLVCPEDHDLVVMVSENIMAGEKTLNIEIRLLTAEGEFKWGEFSARPYTKGGEIVGVFGIIRDTTERKRVEEEVKRRLMKFKLEDGRIYLVREPSTTMSVEAFGDLLKVGYRGHVISRTPQGEFRASFPGIYEFVWLAETGEDSIPPRLDEIESYLKRLPRKNAVFMERLDYLIFKNGFEKTLSFVHRVREIAYLGSHIVIISLDPDTLGRRELRLLEKETSEVEPMHREALPEDLFELLAYIYRQNSMGIKPSHSDIGRDINISKPTVQKRVRSLVSSGYVKEVTKGNRKEVEVLDKGRALFLR